MTVVQFIPTETRDRNSTSELVEFRLSARLDLSRVTSWSPGDTDYNDGNAWVSRIPLPEWGFKHPVPLVGGLAEQGRARSLGCLLQTQDGCLAT